MGLYDRVGGYGYVYHPPVAQPSAPGTSAPGTNAPNPASSYGRYTLDMDPEVVAALSRERTGLADLNSTPMPSMPSTAQYDLALRHLQEDRPIQLERLNYMLGYNKAGLEHQDVINQRNIQNQMAARGLLFSSEKPYLQGERKWAYGRQMGLLTTKDQWARQDLDRNIARQQEAVAAARAAANSAYSEAVAARAQGMSIRKRDLHDYVIQAYVNAYQRVIENPALYLGADTSFNPQDFLSQIPT